MTLPQGKITSRFGWRVHPITGKQSFHNGIDIAMRSGTPIAAPLDGYVVAVYENDKGGKQMRLFCGEYTFGFAHLSRIVVSKGQRVREGEIIAYSGNTGASTAPHLHFTVRKNGELIDPLLLFT